MEQKVLTEELALSKGIALEVLLEQCLKDGYVVRNEYIHPAVGKVYDLLKHDKVNTNIFNQGYNQAIEDIISLLDNSDKTIQVTNSNGFTLIYKETLKKLVKIQKKYIS
jgi:hypothetical protein